MLCLAARDLHEVPVRGKPQTTTLNGTSRVLADGGRSDVMDAIRSE